VVDPTNPNHCCPGTCLFCPDGEGFCEILCNYQIDDQLFAGGIGFGAGQEDAIVMWAHRHVAPPGGDVIEEIRTNYSHTHSAGLPVGWAIFADDGAGGIGPVLAADNSLLTEAGAVGNGDLFNRQVFDTGGVAVSGTFFIAVFSTGSTHPAPNAGADEVSPEVWIAGITVANNPDWDVHTDPATIDPNTWSFAPSNNFGINAIWNVCAKGATGP
jgi:hypothetical protein